MAPPKNGACGGFFRKIVKWIKGETLETLIIAKSVTPNEISFKFIYDGPKQFDGFLIKSDEFERDIFNDEELIIKDVTPGKTYEIELYGKTKGKLLFLGNEKVTVTEQVGVENVNKPLLTIRFHFDTD